MKIKFKKLHEGARLPKKATEGSAAYDLYVAEDVIIKPGRQVIPLGFAMEMPEGIQALVNPRSEFSSKGMEGCKMNLKFSNVEPFYELIPTEEIARFDCDVIEGKIDSDYRGGVGVIIHNHDCTFLVKAGTRIAQMTFSKVESPVFEEVEKLSETERGARGCGSTGA